MAERGRLPDIPVNGIEDDPVLEQAENPNTAGDSSNEVKPDLSETASSAVDTSTWFDGRDIGEASTPSSDPVINPAPKQVEPGPEIHLG